MKAPEVKNAPRFNVSFMNLTEDPDGAYIEYKYVEKHLTQKSATLLAAVAKVRKLTAELARATRALERAGFTDNGAEEWKPPIGWGDTGTQRERLLALEDELARVKAESLRVVKVGEPCALGVCRESHFITGVSDILSCADEFVIGMYGDQIVQPVRLERWEDE